ncbi:hypothetical protein QE250_16670 [Chromatiaceae bacterium AAb-1]|nr:hypothetical protein [Chromatiaceae bacterium AAb-1]
MNHFKVIDHIMAGVAFAGAGVAVGGKQAVAADRILLTPRVVDKLLQYIARCIGNAEGRALCIFMQVQLIVGIVAAFGNDRITDIELMLDSAFR